MREADSAPRPHNIFAGAQNFCLLSPDYHLVLRRRDASTASFRAFLWQSQVFPISTALVAL